MMNERTQNFTPINRSLGGVAKIGFLPLEQGAICLAVTSTAFTFTQNIFDAGWVWTGFWAIFGCATSFLTFGLYPRRYLARFLPVPRINRGVAYYKPLLQHQQRSK